MLYFDFTIHFMFLIYMIIAVLIFFVGYKTGINASKRICEQLYLQSPEISQNSVVRNAYKNVKEYFKEDDKEDDKTKRASEDVEHDGNKKNVFFT